jgi:hypothetical protein
MYRVRIASSGWAGGPGLNTLYFSSAAYAGSEAAAVAAAVRASWVSSLNSMYPSGVNIQVQGEVDDIDETTGHIRDTFSFTPPSVVAGAGSVSSEAIVAAAVVKLTTGAFIAGRRLRGRMFLSPLAADRVNGDGALTSGAVAYGAAFYTSLAAGLPSPVDQVVWHRPVGGSGGSFAAVTSMATNAKIGMLSSRRD